MRILKVLTRSLILMGLAACSAYGATSKPNIIYILADDLGYGDVHCLNPERGKIATPHMDRLASEGMIFTDAHSSSSVCTPTRYAILRRGAITGGPNYRTVFSTAMASLSSRSVD